MAAETWVSSGESTTIKCNIAVLKGKETLAGPKWWLRLPLQPQIMTVNISLEIGGNSLRKKVTRVYKRLYLWLLRKPPTTKPLLALQSQLCNYRIWSNSRKITAKRSQEVDWRWLRYEAMRRAASWSQRRRHRVCHRIIGCWWWVEITTIQAWVVCLSKVNTLATSSSTKTPEALSFRPRPTSPSSQPPKTTKNSTASTSQSRTQQPPSQSRASSEMAKANLINWSLIFQPTYS